MISNVTIARRVAHGLTAALLVLCAGTPMAAELRLTGTTDAGALADHRYDAWFQFADVAADFSGEVVPDALTIDFAGTRWSLGDADATPAVMALFDTGVFIGLQFTSASGTPSLSRPWIQFTPGFVGLDEANFAYATTSAGYEGYAGQSIAVHAVPAPGTALLLAAAAMAALGVRPRPRSPQA